MFMAVSFTPEQEAALEAARDLLPAWIPWMRTIYYSLFAAFGAYLLSRMGTAYLLRPLRRAPAASWVDRARRSFPAQRFSASCLWFFPVIATVAAASTKTLWKVPVPVLALCAFLGAYMNHARLHNRLVEEPRPLRSMLAGTTCFTVVMLPHFAIPLIFAFVMPKEFGIAPVFLLALALVLTVAAVHDRSLAVARALGLARPAPEHVQRIVRDVSERVDIEPQGVLELTYNDAQAFAFVHARVVAFSDVALRILNDRELAAICAHELAHLDEPRRIRRLRFAAHLMFLPVAAAPLIPRQFGLEAFVGALLGYTAVSLLFSRLSQRMETRADRVGQESHEDAGIYASALERIYEYNLTPAVLGQKRQTHPELYDRLIATGVQPDYPRPNSPLKKSFGRETGLFTPSSTASILENLGDYLRLPRPIWTRRDQFSARSTFSTGC